MRVLVCGGRDYPDRQKVFDVLAEIKPTVIIEGGSTGADRHAYRYWREKCDMDAVQWLQFRAEWSDDNIQLHDLDAGDHCQSGRFYPENCTISIVCHACKREMYRKEGAQFD